MFGWCRPVLVLGDALVDASVWIVELAGVFAPHFLDVSPHDAEYLADRCYRHVRRL